MESHAYGHIFVAEVLEYGGLMQTVGIEPEYHAAAKFMREIAEDGIVEKIAVINGFYLDKIVPFDSAGYGERFAFDDTVVVVVLCRNSDGVLILPAFECIGSVGYAVRREEQGQTVNLRTFLEVLHLFGIRGTQYLYACGGVFEFYDIGTYRGYHDGFITSGSEMHGRNSVEIDFLDHDMFGLERCFTFQK
ncbi:unknown [Bacteroides sp. CAG:144]|nr:unknown [Bacteroides sp. CAG:144]